MIEKKISNESTENSDEQRLKERRRSRRLSVSFKEDLVETVQVDGWKQYNQDFSKTPYTAWGEDKTDPPEFKVQPNKKKKKESNGCGESCIII